MLRLMHIVRMPGAPHIWSTGGSGVGDPASAAWMPKCCDTTLQMGDVWFFEPGCPLRDIATMISVFHQTVGRNGVLELDFGINRDGLVDPKHVERYNEFGDWIRGCYDAPLHEARQLRHHFWDLFAPMLDTDLPTHPTLSVYRVLFIVHADWELIGA